MDWELLFHLVFVLVYLAIVGLSLAVAVWSLGWPSVKGMVEASSLEAAVDSDDQISETHELAYSYTVGGIRFLGSNIKPWGGGSGTITGGDSEKTIWNGALADARWYRPGVAVNVYYCPWRPQWSCLEPGGFVFPLLFAGVGGALYFALLR